MAEIYAPALLTITGAFVDVDDVPTNPTDPVLRIQAPNGTTVDVITGFDNPAVGTLTYNADELTAGEWAFQWIGDGGAAAIGEPYVVEVLAGLPVPDPDPPEPPTFLETLATIPSGGWFMPVAGQTCCAAHESLSLRPGCPDEDPGFGDCEPSHAELCEYTTSLLRSAWGPAWPGWLRGQAIFDTSPDCCLELPRSRYATTRWCGPPVWLELPEDRFQCFGIAVAIDGVAVAPANLIVAPGNRIGVRSAGVQTKWSGVVTATYRYGAVPPGAWLPWSRLFCQVRRLYRPKEGLASSLPVLNHVRSVVTSGASVAYSDEEMKQGLLGWDPIVSAFVSQGLAQLEQSQLAGGSWAPSSTAGVARMESSYPSVLLEA